MPCHIHNPIILLSRELPSNVANKRTRQRSTKTRNKVKWCPETVENMKTHASKFAHVNVGFPASPVVSDKHRSTREGFKRDTSEYILHKHSSFLFCLDFAIWPNPSYEAVVERLATKDKRQKTKKRRKNIQATKYRIKRTLPYFPFFFGDYWAKRCISITTIPWLHH